ncbi:peptide chain release factor aRF-1 [Candidatus Woesearchaeota archaeon]|jgi:peptide chain release factor subunit 1|nr:peptide chain release factor aRF-1 [Candidatus Woesearchaeota archaeon]MBT4114421.1 peptide chain release factor aRF-1 [Candidatus Woesearchaeota archaeon]MBT4248284.1 peptide chain release factor aRF-1 [Candidatus Woesearchaeota archaeon]
MSITSKERFKMRKTIAELGKHRARHTELISVYVPAGYSLDKVRQQLSGEAGTARNIKSSTTRKNVQDALERMIRALSLHKHTPPNGLAIFAGNVSEREGQSDVQVWEVEPPTPLNTRVYRCDQAFFIEPLQAFIDIKETYGLIVIDRQEGNIALLKGKAIIPVKNFHSVVPGDTKKGGQSAARFARVREGMLKDFFKTVGDTVNKQFLGNKEIKGILVGGPGPNKESFSNGNFMFTEIKDKIIGIIDTGYTGHQGLEELVERSSDILAQEEVAKEKVAVNRFMSVLSLKPKFAAYGEETVVQAIEAGAVDLLLLSEDIDAQKIDTLAQECEKFKGEWQVISTDTKEGVQLKNLSGIAAILRYPMLE